MDLLLSVCITSYNRVNELKRCIESINIPNEYLHRTEVVISEDKSPQREEIKQMALGIAEKSDLKIRFNSNESNLGYDRNLKKLIDLANGKYIFFMSDDDKLSKKAFPTLFYELEKDQYNLLYAPFLNIGTGRVERKHKETMTMKSGAENAAKYLYDAILFSGLVFRKDIIKDINAERFLNLNYFQVYLFLSVFAKYGARYIDEIEVLCVGDGENAYGFSESSGQNNVLKNRDSVLSNIEFNKGLFKAIKLFDADNNTRVFELFGREYSLHTYSGLSTARGAGLKFYKLYWSKLNELEIKFTFLVRCYYFMLLILGKRQCDFIMKLPQKILFKVRHND